MKKNCVFCGEPMAPGDKECKQCGWDMSKVSAPKSDPADVRARIFVAIGLAAAYFGMFTLINGADLPAQAEPVTRVAVSEPVGTPVSEPAIAIGAADSAITPVRSSVVNVKVADVKNATILPRDAIHYAMQVGEGDRDCRLTGELKSTGGQVEVFLLRDDDFIFWRANPAAIPHSNWEPIRASDTPLSYQIDEPGSYYLIVSNALGAGHKTVKVLANLKCVGGLKKQ
ncbi:MAG TPA: hypothetical protein VM166_15370 [Gemmatimonadaceae bacterium]|nr:hypothetical protein [Gemmatimonadaceae bacterium]